MSEGFLLVCLSYLHYTENLDDWNWHSIYSIKIQNNKIIFYLQIGLESALFS